MGSKSGGTEEVRLEAKRPLGGCLVVQVRDGEGKTMAVVVDEEERTWMRASEELKEFGERFLMRGVIWRAVGVGLQPVGES